jgi:predicted TIM-barrel fold metal-dependent hydrolase
MAMEEVDWNAVADLRLSQWEPRRQLALAETVVERAAFPVVDVHNHLGRWLWGGEASIHDRWTSADGKDWVVQDVDALLRMMDELNIATIVNLDGMWGEELTANLDHYDLAHPGRFVTFCQLDWDLLAEENGVDLLLASLEDSAARGARGVKVWKTLGLTVKDETGALVRPDDHRVLRVLGRAGELGLPVLIHVADPKAFFDPLDRHNERIDELLHEHEWWFGATSTYPTFAQLLESLAKLVKGTPGTTYVGAHVGCAAEDLDWVGQLMQDAPNFSIDIASRIGELGRQPRRFRELIEQFPDRIMFGTDNFPPDRQEFTLHFRFLETADEAFDYSLASPIPPQGRWTVSGIALKGEQLAAIYGRNAARLLGLDIPAGTEEVAR